MPSIKSYLSTIDQIDVFFNKNITHLEAFNKHLDKIHNDICTILKNNIVDKSIHKRIQIIKNSSIFECFNLVKTAENKNNSIITLNKEVLAASKYIDKYIDKNIQNNNKVSKITYHISANLVFNYIYMTKTYTLDNLLFATYFDSITMFKNNLDLTNNNYINNINNWFHFAIKFDRTTFIIDYLKKYVEYNNTLQMIFDGFWYNLTTIPNIEKQIFTEISNNNTVKLINYIDNKFLSKLNYISVTYVNTTDKYHKTYTFDEMATLVDFKLQ